MSNIRNNEIEHPFLIHIQNKGNIIVHALVKITLCQIKVQVNLIFEIMVHYFIFILYFHIKYEYCNSGEP